MSDLRSLVETAQKALIAERLKMGTANPVLRYALNFHRTDRGDRLVFAGRPWLLSLYEMWGEQPPRGSHVVFMKATQTGISEMLVVLTWAWTAELGYRVLYVLPRVEDRAKFYGLRFRKPMEHVSRYRALTRRSRADSLSEYLTTIGPGSRILAGSNSRASFTSVPVDVAVIDEWDECDQENLVMVPERLAWAGSRRVRIDVGNPTVTDFGIHRKYAEGSQHEWWVRCTGCERETALDFFRHVVEEEEHGEYRVRDAERWASEKGDIRALCDDCGEELDRLGPGRWVAANPSATIRSFHISKLFDGSYPLRELVSQFLKCLGDAAALQRFYNSRLGIPYTPAGGKITAAMVRRCRFRYRDLSRGSWAPIRTMGIDVGSPHKVVVSDLPDPADYGWRPRTRGDGTSVPPPTFRRLIWATEVRSLHHIDSLVERFRPRVVCIDSRPEVEAVIEARKRWGRILGGLTRVWRVEYRWDRIEDVTLDYREGLAKVDRTLLLDRMVADWRDRRRIVPENVEALAGRAYVQELCVPTRIQEEGPRKEPVYRWSKGKDHFFHADGYDRLAAELCRRGRVSGGHQEWAGAL